LDVSAFFLVARWVDWSVPAQRSAYSGFCAKRFGLRWRQPPLFIMRFEAATPTLSAYHERMPNIAGVDGCPAGWIAIVENSETGSMAAVVFANFAQLATVLDTAVIAIDIPIGLTDCNARHCDVLARKHLGPKRGTSVFPAPIRPALHASSYEDAKATSRAVQNKGISKQGWMIYPKIREIDHALRASADLRARVFEVHPEVTFSAWSGAPIILPKRKAAGHAIRRILIDDSFGPRAFESARTSIARRDATDDDIADAFAALWTARRIIAGDARSIPDSPPLDSAGLPMRMMY
jgi:predicted RNase H-like nuclease